MLVGHGGFNHVKFTTRSFIDEIYNLFLRHPEENAFRVDLINEPEDIKTMFNAVSRTQIHVKMIPL